MMDERGKDPERQRDSGEGRPREVVAQEIAASEGGAPGSSSYERRGEADQETRSYQFIPATM
jgi:hypothetical protein